MWTGTKRIGKGSLLETEKGCHPAFPELGWRNQVFGLEPVTPERKSQASKQHPSLLRTHRVKIFLYPYKTL